VDSPALEDLYIKKLENFRAASRRALLQLEDFGVTDAPGAAAFPAFETTGLLDAPEIREAYDFLIHDPRTIPNDFEAALRAGRILSGLPSKNPVTVAAALLDVGMRSLAPEDMEFFENRFDPAVLDILSRGSVYRPMTPESLRQAPEAFRQLTLAYFAACAEISKESCEDFLQLIRSNPQTMRPENAIGPLTRIAQEVAAARTLAPMTGASGSPELEKVFQEKMTELDQFIASHLPPKPRQLTGPKKEQRPDSPGP
jgi:hypothetical protein